MASADTDSVHNHMARLRMKMVQQKIQNEKDRLMNRSTSPESINNDVENQARLQQAMLRRQELLDKIRREQLINDEKRPRSYSARRRYTPSPLPAPPTRRSLPDFGQYHQQQQQPQYIIPQQGNVGNITYRTNNPDMSQVKHVIEHKIATPKPQHLPPLQQQAPAIYQQGPAQHHIMQAPQPQIIQIPGQQHLIQQIPQQPVYQTLGGGGQSDNRSMFNKGDFIDVVMLQNTQMNQIMMQQMMANNIHNGQWFMDMLMMQNAQMHQMVMQNLMLKSMTGKQQDHHSDHHHHHCSSPLPRIVHSRQSTGAVHHHHYTSPPPSQPQQQAVTHYTTLPPMEVRGYPYSGGGGGEYEYYEQPYVEYYR